ncbi:MAG: agmatine/peptidylarginine deiminase, partial [Micrococcales bacterium]
MPAEWQAHERTFMAWPTADYTRAEAQFKAWAQVANAVVDFEPVTMLVNQGDLQLAQKYLSQKVELHETRLDDAWMRDIGPTYVRDGDQLKAVSWVFNGWGAQGGWATWENDNLIAEEVAKLSGTTVVQSSVVNEGGGIHVNGLGKILLTETVQLGKGRNPNLSKEQVEQELTKQLGVDDFIWVKRGLTRDYEEFGTQGHIDIVACFSDENTVLYHDQQNPKHPDYRVSREVEETLIGHGLKLIAVPAPTILEDHEVIVDFSYINHYIVNGAVILCAFDDE